MTDVVSPAVRSRMMSSIRGRDTKPEMTIRRGMHAMGYRYRLNDRSLPGRPDLVFPKYRAVIFVHGCFWHRHDCHLFKWPGSRKEFWKDKLNKNAQRDKLNAEKLIQLGWRVAIVWECSIKGKNRIAPNRLLDLCAKWLQSGGTTMELGG